MATYHGNDGEIHVGANTVLEVTGFSHSNSAESADDSAAGDDYRTRKFGKKDGGGTLNFRYDPASASHQVDLVVGSNVAVTLYPGGVTTGCGKLTGNIDVENIEIGMDQDDINSRTVTYKGYLAESVVSGT